MDTSSSLDVMKENDSNKIILLLNNQRATGDFCDVKIIMKSNIMYAHTAVLAHYSAYVKNMCLLSSDDECPNTNQKYKNFSINEPLIIDIPGNIEGLYCIDCMSAVLDFIYLNRVVTQVHLSHIIAIKSFFEIDDLLHTIFTPHVFTNPPAEAVSSLPQTKKKIIQKHTKTTSKRAALEPLSVQYISRRKALLNPTTTACKGKVYTCIHCNYQCYRPANLILHLRVSAVCLKERVCSLCQTEIGAAQNLESHLVLHDHPKPFFCNSCDLRFPSRTTLNHHIPKHSTETPFVCPHCRKGFKWKNGLTSHLIVHSKEMKHLCDECGFSTAHAKTLRAHKLVHTGALLRCPFPGCNHSSQRKENLKIHVATHSKETPFVCEVCGHKFSQSKNLKRHALTHDPTFAQHQCPHCAFRTPRSDKLREHVLRQHTEKPLDLELSEHVQDTFGGQSEHDVGGILSETFPVLYPALSDFKHKDSIGIKFDSLISNQKVIPKITCRPPSAIFENSELLRNNNKANTVSNPTIGVKRINKTTNTQINSKQSTVVLMQRTPVLNTNIKIIKVNSFVSNNHLRPSTSFAITDKKLLKTVVDVSLTQKKVKTLPKLLPKV